MQIHILSRIALLRWFIISNGLKVIGGTKSHRYRSLLHVHDGFVDLPRVLLNDWSEGLESMRILLLVQRAIEAIRD